MFQKGQLFQMGKERYIKMNQRIKNMKIDQKCPFSPDIGNKKSNEHVSRLGMWEKSRLRKMEKDAF